jgi:SNF2 family DNA or RNA helicase
MAFEGTKAENQDRVQIESQLNLPHHLRVYQWEGVQFLVNQDFALLADEMGLGKTIQAAVALSIKARTGSLSRALIVVPASLRLNWEHELLRWVPNLSVRIVRGDATERHAFYRLPFNVLIASYDQVRTDSILLATETFFDVVVADEAQRIKNVDSDTALACRMLKRRCSWALTGTPLENSVADLISVYRFARPGLITASMSKGEMHAAIRPFFLRRRQKDVLGELPPLLSQDIPLELEGQQRQAYDRVWLDRESRLAGSTKQTSISTMLALITQLKKICNYDPDSNVSVKMDALTVIIEGLSAVDHKLLVFSQYVKTLEWIRDQLQNTLAIDMLHGGMDDLSKSQAVARFNEEPGPRVLLVSLRAGGVGLNLQSASHVVLFDRWWNPAVEEQATRRAYRFGRDRPLYVYRFLVVGSVEEKIAAILAEKKMVFEQYVESAESARLQSLSMSELSRILELRMP